MFTMFCLWRAISGWLVDDLTRCNPFEILHPLRFCSGFGLGTLARTFGSLNPKNPKISQNQPYIRLRFLSNLGWHLKRSRPTFSRKIAPKSKLKSQTGTLAAKLSWEAALKMSSENIEKCRTWYFFSDRDWTYGWFCEMFEFLLRYLGI